LSAAQHLYESYGFEIKVTAFIDFSETSCQLSVRLSQLFVGPNCAEQITPSRKPLIGGRINP
jgi:hypothetical protein